MPRSLFVGWLRVFEDIGEADDDAKTLTCARGGTDSIPGPWKTQLTDKLAPLDPTHRSRGRGRSQPPKMGSDDLSVGTACYAFTDGAWARGSVARTSGGKYDVSLSSGGNCTVKTDECAPASRLAPTGVPDMSALDTLHEGALQENVKARYKRREIYTLCSTLLVSVNPYTDLGIYGEETIVKYSTRVGGPGGAGGGAAAVMRARSATTVGGHSQLQRRRRSVQDTSLPPHLFGVADVAYATMADKGEPQAVVISGESGAGKTEGTKVLNLGIRTPLPRLRRRAFRLPLCFLFWRYLHRSPSR